MKLETFFEKFELIADAPGAVARIRELIIESAIRGKLVPQDADDEPASELLRRIEKSQAGSSHKQAALPPVGDDAYLELPPGWAWTRLGNTGRIFNGDSVSESVKAELAKVKEGLPFIATKDMGYGRDALAYDNGLKVPPGDPRFKIAQKNAVLICAEGGSAGRKIGISDRDICFGNKLFANDVHNEICFRYIFYVYQASTFFKAFSARMTGIIGGISRREFLLLPIPLPPLAEQKRIVAKVDELMALCDRLEAQQQERDTRHAALVRASLARFTEAPTPANLEFLFHPSYEVTPADLRKTILTLAVQGKLVPQDPNDEPAEHLIERVSAALPNKKSENPFLTRIEASITDESEYELPYGWAWLPLGHVGVWATGCGFPSQYQGETDKEFLFCKVSDMNLPGNEIEIRTTVHTIDAAVMKKIRARANPAGTVIFPKIGGAIATHKRRLVIKPTIIDNNCSGIQPVGLTDDGWLLLLMRNLDLTKYQSGTSVPAVSQRSLDPIRIGLPPLAEQRRIVAKVEQLMALVDELEQQLAASRATAEKLLTALVAELTNGKEAHANAEV